MSFLMGGKVSPQYKTLKSTPALPTWRLGGGDRRGRGRGRLEGRPAPRLVVVGSCARRPHWLQKVWALPGHFSFFSSPRDAAASVPSLDSVTVAVSLGLDSS